MSIAADYAEDRSPGLALWRATLAWQARQRAALRPHGLTHVQFVLLAMLVNRPAPVTQAELARRAGLDPMMTSQVLRALERAELVHRRASEQDARALLITATSNGTRVANAAVVDVEAVDRLFFAPIDSTEELTRLLVKLA